MVNKFSINEKLRFDLFMHCDVAQRDVQKFQEAWGLPVLQTGREISNGLGDVAPILNCLSENLWFQDCATAGTGCQHSQQETANQEF